MMNDSARIEMFNAESIANLQTTFFNKVVSDAKELGININFKNVNHDGFKFHTIMEGQLETDEAKKAIERAQKEQLKLHDLKVGDAGIVYNRRWRVVGYDASKYRRNITIQDDNGKVVNVTAEVFHQGMADLGQMVASKKKTAAPKKERAAAPKAKRTRGPNKPKVAPQPAAETPSETVETQTEQTETA